MRYQHSSHDVARTVSAFFAVRRIMRTMLATQSKIDPETWPQIETLKFIADHHEPMMKDLAEYLHIKAPSATALVRRLEKSGFVTNAVDAFDRRTTRLALTKKGKKELERTIAHGTDILRTLFDSVSKKDLEHFYQTLTRLQKRGE